ncbi:hypothetical protein K435DRAFT_872662 [Dendrothele bispora CBS 962.96]|uniref:DUF6534 domain-containing protein n=1 Tax=Dendrothele bispora (strain CBS 962.96) TaxID=1314807 RepID=A0A4S8L129_DENBC|nr:hypothetical protein K435DRAFT_872662 [Dendrothele bispora CBS 962.96]
MSYLLMGIIIMQVYVYYMSFPRDKLWIKAAVYTLFALDLVQTVAVTDSSWSFLITGWGRPEHLHITEWGFAFIPFFCGICSAGVQLFFAWRIRSLASRSSEKKVFLPIVVVIVCASFTQSIASVVASARWSTINDIFEFHLIFAAVSVWLVGSAVTDVIIAISMIYLLNSARSKTRQAPLTSNIRRTDHLLSRLIRNSIETGSITAGAAILDVIFFLTMNETSIHFAFSVSLSKLYTNTLYASLNARVSFQRDVDRDTTTAISDTINVRSEGTTSSGNLKSAPQHQISFTQDKSGVETTHWQDSMEDRQGTIPMVSMGKDSLNQA